MERLVNLFKFQKTTESAENNDNFDANKPWAHLPYTVAVEVVKYLEDQDRASFAQVCKRWRLATKDPSLWRAKGMVFGGPVELAFGTRAIQFVKLYGRHLQHLCVNCMYLPGIENEGIVPKLRQFLRFLGCSRLLTFRVESSELKGRWNASNVHLRRKLAPLIGTFLRTQAGLKMFSMNAVCFPLSDGVQLLEALSASASQSLECVELVAFFRPSEQVSQSQSFTNAVSSFRHLVIVQISFSYLNDEVLLAWAQLGTLGRLHLLADELDVLSVSRLSTWATSRRVIRNDTWQEVRSRCPHLLVMVSFTSVSDNSVMISYLAPAMPLYRLAVIGETRDTNIGPVAMRDDQVEHLSRTLRHVTSNHSRRDLLELELELGVISSHDSFDAALSDLLNNLQDGAKAGIQMYSYYINDFPRLRQLQEQGRCQIIVELTGNGLLFYNIKIGVLQHQVLGVGV